MDTEASVATAVSPGSAVSTAATTGGMVVPYKGDAPGRVGGVIGSVAAAVGVAAVGLWML